MRSPRRRPNRRSRRWSEIGPLALAWLFFAGCAGYRLGPTSGQQAGEKSIRIESVRNETIEPRLTESLTTSLRRQLQQDGTFRLETRRAGDITLRSVIVRYERSGLSYNPQDLFTPRDFELSMTAHVTAFDADTGRTLLDREVSGRTTVRSDRDLTSAERQALSMLTEDLARNTLSLLVDGDW